MNIKIVEVKSLKTYANRYGGFGLVPGGSAGGSAYIIGASVEVATGRTEAWAKHLAKCFNEYDALCKVVVEADKFVFNTSLPSEPLLEALATLANLRKQS